MAWPWRRRPTLDRHGSLAARPLRNPVLEWTRDDEGMVLLRLPRKEGWWVKALARLFYVPKGKTFSLDEPGSFVWGLCDGETPIRSIVQQFAERFQLTRKEAEVSTLQYFRMLAQRGFVGLAVEQKARETEKQKGS